jgi:hypothetical protein
MVESSCNADHGCSSIYNTLHGEIVYMFSKRFDLARLIIAALEEFKTDL